ncbi:MAG: hypothetical protein J7K04_01590 [Spirochaetales bacterium]|nr:hypothetical protein [Spirochaetales bacterium]
MKKIIIISILAVSVIFLFSGCDAILEAMFPDETGHGDKSGNNSITINVDIDKGIPGWQDSEVWVELVGVNGNDYYNTRHDFAWDDGNINNPAHIDLNFDFLPDGDYNANVWLDKNGNGYADNDEPFAFVRTDYGNTFPMPYPNPNNPDETSPGMEFQVSLGTMNMGAIPIVIMGQKTVNINDILSSYTYDVMAANPDYGVSGFDWKVNNPDSIYNNGTIFSTNFSSFGEGIAWLVLDNIVMSSSDGEITVPHYEEAVRIVDEPKPGAEYMINVDSWCFDMPPWNLDLDSTFNVRIEIFDHNHNYLNWSHNYLGGLTEGGFSISTQGTDMGPRGDGSFDYSTVAEGTDIIRVYIDTDGNGGETGSDGYQDNEDLVYESEIGLSKNIDDHYGTYWRYFNFEPFRFMKAKDFYTVYPY